MKSKRAPGRNPLLGLVRSWDGYQTRLETALELGGEALPELLATLERHARILRNRYEEARETSTPPAAATA